CSGGLNNVEYCNGVDDDCDGSTDNGCIPPLISLLDCDLDGDDLPPTDCAPPPLGAADNVACVCASPPCADPLCDTSHASIAGAPTALGALSAPSGILVFAGTYLGFTTDLSGSNAAKPLFVGAHCAGGTREPVVLTGAVEVRTPHVTLEGMRLDAGLT